MVKFFSTKYMANYDFSEPPRRTGSKNPISIFAEFGSVTSGARRSISVGFWGAHQLSPFGGGSSQRAASTPPPPPKLTARPPLCPEGHSVQRAQCPGTLCPLNTMPPSLPTTLAGLRT